MRQRATRHIIIILAIGKVFWGPSANALECAIAFGDAFVAIKEEKAARFQAASKYNSGGVSDEAKNIRAEVVSGFETLRIFPASGRTHEGVQVRVLLLHGVGMSYSSSSSWHSVINVLGATELGKSGSTINFVRSDPDFVQLGAEAIDLMRHGVGPKLVPQFFGLGSVIDWIADYLTMMKRETPNLPVVVVARSASPRFIAEVNRRYPGLIDGVVLVSPVVPGGRSRDRLQLEGTLNEAKSSGSSSSLNWNAIEWFFRITRKLDWNTPNYFGATPVLVLSGSRDTQVTDDDRRDLVNLANTIPNFEYHELEGAGHNVFATSHKAPGKKAYQLLYQFINQKVLGSKIRQN